MRFPEPDFGSFSHFRRLYFSEARMAIEPTIPWNREERFEEAIVSFEQARDAGANPDPREWLERYADVAEQLAAYFADGARMGALAAPLLRGQVGEDVPDLPDYQILQRVAEGGQGVVYKAWQLSAERIVALKVMQRDRLQGLRGERRQQALDRFRTEAQAAARLEHPNIVGIHEINEHDGRPYCAMQFVHGPSLADLIAQGPVEARQAAAYLEPVARAVDVAHKHGILHRDLKPANILLQIEQDRRADVGQDSHPAVRQDSAVAQDTPPAVTLDSARAGQESDPTPPITSPPIAFPPVGNLQSAIP